MGTEYILQMKNIKKSFSGVEVLHGVDLDVRAGEVRALVGENGTGKSTLMKILGGIYDSDSGEIYINGKKTSISSAQDAQDLGVSIIHQEIVLVQDITVGENIFIGREPLTKFGFINYKEIYERSLEILASIGLKDMDPNTIVRELTISQQQMIEIAKAISTNAKIIVMDEPTSSLTDREIEFLFDQIRKLREKNVSIIYISHKMDELSQIADSITIMRDGYHILTKAFNEITYDEIVQNMVGHKIEDYYPTYEPKIGKEMLRVENLSTDKVKNISFSLHEGEILGLIGLMGAGRSELANALFGIDKLTSGSIYLEGEKCFISSPEVAIKNKIGHVTEDRKLTGLFLQNDIAFNMTITVLNDVIHGIRVNRKLEQQILDSHIHLLDIKMAGTDQLAVELSGGNQQKVVISKWLAANPRILILDEPTRGVDVGAKSDIYHLITKIAEQGVAVIFISSELPEVMNMSTRIGVMCEGELVKFMDPRKEEVTQEKIMHYAIGGNKDGIK